jgi:hypothetical protein
MIIPGGSTMSTIGTVQSLAARALELVQQQSDPRESRAIADSYLGLVGELPQASPVERALVKSTRAGAEQCAEVNSALVTQVCALSALAHGTSGSIGVVLAGIAGLALDGIPRPTDQVAVETACLLAIAEATPGQLDQSFATSLVRAMQPVVPVAAVNVLARGLQQFATGITPESLATVGLGLPIDTPDPELRCTAGVALLDAIEQAAPFSNAAAVAGVASRAGDLRRVVATAGSGPESSRAGIHAAAFKLLAQGVENGPVEQKVAELGLTISADENDPCRVANARLALDDIKQHAVDGAAAALADIAAPFGKYAYSTGSVNIPRLVLDKIAHDSLGGSVEQGLVDLGIDVCKSKPPDLEEISDELLRQLHARTSDGDLKQLAGYGMLAGAFMRRYGRSWDPVSTHMRDTFRVAQGILQPPMPSVDGSKRALEENIARNFAIRDAAERVIVDAARFSDEATAEVSTAAPRLEAKHDEVTKRRRDKRFCVGMDVLGCATMGIGTVATMFGGVLLGSPMLYILGPVVPTLAGATVHEYFQSRSDHAREAVNSAEQEERDVTKAIDDAKLGASAAPHVVAVAQRLIAAADHAIEVDRLALA